MKRALSSVVAAVLLGSALCACAAGLRAYQTPGALPDVSRSGIAQTVYSANRLLFEGDSGKGAVDIFDVLTRKQTGRIVGFDFRGCCLPVNDISTDPNGDLVVADTLNQQIKIFAAPYDGKPVVLSDAGWYPTGVHADAQGNLWVANLCSGSLGGWCDPQSDGDVVVFKHGSTTPTLVGYLNEPLYVTTDAVGDVWTDVFQCCPFPMYQVGYWEHGQGTFITTNIPVISAGPLAFDKSGNLVLVDQGAGPHNSGAIELFHPQTVFESTVKPFKTISPSNKENVGYGIALSSDEKEIYATDASTGEVYVLTYPGGRSLGTITPNHLGNGTSAAVVPVTLP